MNLKKDLTPVVTVKVGDKKVQFPVLDLRAVIGEQQEIELADNCGQQLLSFEN